MRRHESPTPDPAPRGDWRMVGHEWAVEYLQRAVASELSLSGAPKPNRTKLRPAYLFVGPPQIGKSTLVRAFAQALLCTGNDVVDGAVPCGDCRSCRLMARGQHPDFRHVQPTNSDGSVDRTNGVLRVEQSSDLIRDASLMPVEGRYKIFHIQNVELAHVNFANKILKTLEEPPSHVVICLTASDQSLLLPTIVSRCEVLELRPVPVATVKDALVSERDAAPDQAELLARLCGGRFGWAVRQLSDTPSASQRLETLEELRHLIAADRVERLRFAERTAANRDNQKLFTMLEIWVTWWRDVLLEQHGAGDSISNIDHHEELQRHARTVPSVAVQRHVETLMRVERYLHHTVNTRLAMDALVLDMPRPS